MFPVIFHHVSLIIIILPQAAFASLLSRLLRITRTTWAYDGVGMLPLFIT